MQAIHWNYFFAIEDDLATLSRYIEFHPDNFATYSIENARILMAAAQEIDVLLKAICGHYGAPAANVHDYYKLLADKHPNIRIANVTLSHHALIRTPFANWTESTPPLWWTGNNKVKHARDTEFKMASLENVIDAASALLIVNVYHQAIVGGRNFKLSREPRFFDLKWFWHSVGGHSSASYEKIFGINNRKQQLGS